MPTDQPRSRIPWIAGGFLAAALVAAVVIVIAYGHRDATPRTGGHHPSATATVSASSNDCPIDTTTRPPVSTPPPGVKWTPLPAEVPVEVPDGGHQYGPCRVTKTVANGYAHTPSGALMAATQIFIRSFESGEMGRQTIQQQVVDGRWKQKLLDNVPSSASSSTERPAIAAYSINSYTAGAAQLSLALSYSTTATYLVFQLDVQWQQGDWRLVAPPGGDWQSLATQMATLDGFVAWGPQQ